MSVIADLIKRKGGGSSCPKNSTTCKPATARETMIIAICFGVVIFLIFVLFLWYYRLFCCCARRRGDTRSWKEIMRDGFDGWSKGGLRPRKQPAGAAFEKLNSDDSSSDGNEDVEKRARTDEERFEPKWGTGKGAQKATNTLAAGTGVLTIVEGVVKMLPS